MTDLAALREATESRARYDAAFSHGCATATQLEACDEALRAAEALVAALRQAHCGKCYTLLERPEPGPGGTDLYKPCRGCADRAAQDQRARDVATELRELSQRPGYYDSQMPLHLEIEPGELRALADRLSTPVEPTDEDRAIAASVAAEAKRHQDLDYDYTDVARD